LVIGSLSREAEEARSRNAGAVSSLSEIESSVERCHGFEEGSKSARDSLFEDIRSGIKSIEDGLRERSEVIFGTLSDRGHSIVSELEGEVSRARL